MKRARSPSKWLERREGKRKDPRYLVALLCTLILGAGLLVAGSFSSREYWGRMDRAFFSSRATPFATNGAPTAIYDVQHRYAEYYKGRTYITYQGEDNDPFVTYYDHGTGNWHEPVRVGRNPLETDPHGAPSLLVDSEGYIHVFYGAHGGRLRHSVSASPESIDAWEKLDPPSLTATYPQPMMLGDTIYLFYRNGLWKGGADWVLQTSSDGGRTWSGKRHILHGERRPNWYDWYATANKGRNGGILLSFVRFEPRPSEEIHGVRRDLYYIRYKNGRWTNAEGERLGDLLPLDKAQANERARVWTGRKWANNPDPRIGPNGHPMILFSGGKERWGGWKLAEWRNGGWRVTRIASGGFFKASMEVADGKVRAYLIRDRGTRVEVWERGGGAWSRRRVVFDSANVRWDGHVKATQLVANHRGEAKVVFCQMRWKPPHVEWSRPVYLWGENGYIGRKT